MRMKGITIFAIFVICTVVLAKNEGNTESQDRLKRQTSNTAPSFAHNIYRASAPENQPVGFSVIQVTASDPDQGENGKLTYSMSAIRDSRSNNMFSINPLSGLVTTTEVLDREEIPRHEFKVMATDNNVLLRKSAVATLIINVEDMNDNAPTFNKAVYLVDIYENSPVGTTILAVRATDRDIGNAQEIRYSIIKPANSSAFKIDPVSGSISTMKELDREEQGHYELALEAKDLGDNFRLTSTAEVLITVLDENDNAPTFSQNYYNVSISEVADIGTFVFQMMATDSDSGDNGAIHYRISAGNTDAVFNINAQSGVVFLQKRLDLLNISKFILEVSAFNDDITHLGSHTTLQINVIAAATNTNALRFQRQQYTAEVIESISIGAAILTVHALHNNKAAHLEYSIPGASSSFPFIIDPHLGRIFVHRRLDRETKDHYTFTVLVKDHNVLPMSATTSIEIIVNDVNDNMPVFPKDIWNISISEDSPVYLEVLQVSAIDTDTQVNAQITYSITSGNNNNTFSIGSRTGIITLEKDLHDKIQKNYSLRVTATDGFYTTSARVYIHVIGMNKQAPSFQTKTYTFNVNENVAIGTSVGVVKAVDNDVGENGKIIYELLTGTREFTVNKSTGEIRTRAFLDREAVPAYSIEVRASDNGVNRLQDTAGIIISVNDLNDNAPVFIQPVYQASITKPVISGKKVITVRARDADFGVNSQVRYHFDPLNSNQNNFNIDSLNGAIYVANSNTIDTESVRNYTLGILAVDRGVPPLTASAQIRINVAEVVVPVG